MSQYDEDFAIHHALECTPASDRKRLAKIVDELDSFDRSTINHSIQYHVRDFNYSRSGQAGSAGQVAYAALVEAIKAVKTGRSPSTRPLIKR
ncbi:hypothetical protein [Pseudomonas putida]|uniref:Uncharacterized protein n=1 Tax=Pseudomonas putida TaxID=303 RepID=A0A8I1JJT4_PSEPU|nr:hypothetical protein [Pseudomonas putida]MBI6882730.1 hypothetical protein [Pseudomonas putida]